MGDVAAAVLAAAAEQEKLLPSIQVEKAIPLEIDLGNMLALDDNQIDNDKLADESSRDDYLVELARDNTQLLINSIFTLPTHRVEEVVVATFPPPTFRLPREKPLPKPKELTKWEKYAKEKGIVKKKKKDRVAWDDTLNQWVHQYGYKKKQAEDEKNWCIPIKESANPNITPHEQMEEDKKERKAKNEFQRLRNLARNKNLPTVGVVTSTKTNTGEDLKKAAEIVKESTASLGKFQPNLHKNLEKSAKTKGKKRKFESNTMDSKLERERNLGILDSITNKQPRLDITAAVGKSIHQEESERSEEKKSARGGKKGGKNGKKGGKKGKSFHGKKKVGKSFGGGGGGKKTSSFGGSGGRGGGGGGRGGGRSGKSRGGKR